MYEQFVGDFTYRDSGSRQVHAVIFKLREFSSDHLAPSLIFFHLQWYYDSLPYLNHMLRARYIGMSLATVLCECSLNH